jgi:hypothetical protein
MVEASSAGRETLSEASLGAQPFVSVIEIAAAGSATKAAPLIPQKLPKSRVTGENASKPLILLARPYGIRWAPRKGRQI